MFEKLFDFDNFEKFKENTAISICNINRLNPELNAFCNVYEKEFLENSKRIYEKVNRKETLPLSGLIIGIKDLFCYKDHPVQAASKILDKFISPYNSTVIDRILSNDGLIIGHQNCDEFGMGSSNENSIYGCVRNFFNKNKTSGGSSGGSAVAVQTDMCHVSIGTDTGGSIRQPAAFCGVIGFKPTYGLISRYGVIAHASSFDTVGIIAKKIKNIYTVFKTIYGHDNHDLSMSSYIPKDSCCCDKKYKIAYFSDILDMKILNSNIKNTIDIFLSNMKENDHIVDAVSFSLLQYVVPVYYILTTVEVCSNLARYDGVRYGYRTKDYSNFDELITKTRSEGFGYEVKKRIMLGNYIFKTRNINNYFNIANNIREKLKEEIDNIFLKYDFIVLPTTATTATEIGTSGDDNIDIYLSDIFTVIASLAGLPAISIPYGVDNDNMPIGVQIIGKKYSDFELLNFAKLCLK
jgi:aspartyl-tRNA(Asn)/glutamyl-tRNA(Gln) amidotransferase subunit A